VYTTVRIGFELLLAEFMLKNSVVPSLGVSVLSFTPTANQLLTSLPCRSVFADDGSDNDDEQLEL
jgi:hypothetical protein